MPVVDQVVIVADATSGLGAGHIGRALVMSKQISSRISIVINDSYCDKNYIESVLPVSSLFTKIDWVTEETVLSQDPKSTRRCLVVDTYLFEERVHTLLSIAQEAVCIVLITDNSVEKNKVEELVRLLHEKVQTVVVIEYGLGIDFREEHSTAGKKLIVLTGSSTCDFACFEQLTCGQPPLERGKVHVIISYGANNLAKTKVLSTLKKIKYTIPFQRDKPEIWISEADYRSNESDILETEMLHIFRQQDLWGLMPIFDVYIGAAGTTALQAAYFGAEIYTEALVQNQMRQYEQMLRLLNARHITTIDTLRKKSAASRNMQALIGQGVNLSQALGLILGDNTLESIDLREATMADSQIIYHCRYSKNANYFSTHSRVPSFEEHLSWLGDNIGSYLIIVRADTMQSLGYLRLEKAKSGKEASLSIAIHPWLVGHGVGKRAISMLLFNLELERVNATIHKDNAPSLALFRGLGFRYVGESQLYKNYVYELTK